MRHPIHTSPIVALIVDDDPFFQETLRLQLESLGVDNILLADDGAAALALLRQRSVAVDLVVCDVSMPGADGFQVLSEIAQTGFDGKLLFVSGMDPAALQLLKLFACYNRVNLVDAVEKPVCLSRLGKAISGLSTH